MNDKKTSAIIVAAGSSSRMGGIDKQFLEIDEVPVIIRTLSAFQKSEFINEIIVSTKQESKETIESLSIKYGISKLTNIVSGGKTRQESVFNALQVVDKDADFIAIHDGARPLISLEGINKTIQSAFEHNAAAIGVRVKDTIKVVDEKGFIVDTPERSKLWAVQTPQVFKKELYQKAVNELGEKASLFTDDCKLLETIGVKVFMVEGEYSNIKITTPEDVLSASVLLN
ncbi:MAG: 2-C-methyl-D-erythritol 4-phosphate cytidylyltransferase [Clostridiales bacterium]|nr:2-C-methyl-D-erythritol 4-phosphate cytidylyltransferase [Clostridiales bacterium]